MYVLVWYKATLVVGSVQLLHTPIPYYLFYVSDSILSFLCFRVKYFLYFFFLVNLAVDFVLLSNIDDQLDSCTWWSTLECLGNVIFGIPHGHFFDFGAEFFFFRCGIFGFTTQLCGIKKNTPEHRFPWFSAISP